VVLCAHALANVGQLTSVSAVPIALQHGEQYVALVRATNAAGLTTDVYSNTLLVVDATPPVGGDIRVRAGQAFPASYFASEGSLTVEWEHAHDTESGIESCELCFGGTPGADDLVACVYVSSDVHHDVSVSQLGGVKVAFASIFCTNGAGLRSFQSAEFVLDSSGPTAGEVMHPCDVTLDIRDGVDCVHFDAHTLSARWEPWEDDESGISH
jgi:hypothetical protein